MRTQEVAAFVGRLRNVVAFLLDRRGTAFTEFALVGPVLLMLTIGTVDVGRLVWSSAMLHHLAREATRFASIRGADSSSPVDEADVENFVNGQLIGFSPGEVAVNTTWTPNNSPGGTVQVQLDYTYSFLVGSLLGLDPLPVQGESSMLVF